VAHRRSAAQGSGPGRQVSGVRRPRREGGADSGGDGRVPFVVRPFEGLPGETDWVALREFVPAATATVGLLGDHADRDVRVASVLPQAHPAIVRADGAIWLGVQTAAAGGSGDASRELADALERALVADPGTPVLAPDRFAPGRRLQDLLDPAVAFTVTVHADLGFWLEDSGHVEPDVRASLDRANATLAPTARVLEEESAYWTRIGARTYVRWVLPGSDDASLDALARLHAAGTAALVPDSRLLGSFRACGLLVPVWQLPDGADAAAVTEPLRELAARLAEARSTAGPLTDAERRSRSGLLSRQVTLH
jgi:hypothetical protein